MNAHYQECSNSVEGQQQQRRQDELTTEKQHQEEETSQPVHSSSPFSEQQNLRDQSVFSEHTLRVIDRDIGFCRYGTGPSRFLFICGGVGCYKKDFPEDPVLRAFDPSIVTIVCIDPPGYGRSRPPDRRQEVSRCRKDSQYCLELMKQLGLIPFTVLGWSEGGQTAIHVAADGPDAVSHVVLIATNTQVDLRGEMAIKGMRNTRLWLPSVREPYLRHYSEEFLREQWAALCDVVSIVYSDLGGRFTCDHVLARIHSPVLIINGGMDRFLLDPKLITSKLKDARIEIHARGGHDPHIKHSRWFATKVMELVKGHYTNGCSANAFTTGKNKKA